MARTIGFAGIDGRLHRQLVQTANLMHSSYNKCFVTEWAEGPCDVVFADGRTGVGQSAMAAAAGSGTPIVEVAESHESTGYLSVRPRTSTAALTRMIRAALGEAGSVSAA